LRYSTPDGSTTAGPKYVTRASGTAKLVKRRYIKYPALPLPLPFTTEDE